MKRRNFIRTAGGAALMTPVLPALNKGSLLRSSGIMETGPQVERSTVIVKEKTIQVNTWALSATITNGLITSLKSRLTGEDFITNVDTNNSPALQLLYTNSELADITGSGYGSVVLNQISDQRAEIVIHSWNGDGVIAVCTDDQTGDLIIEPSAYSSRPGVIACRWNLTGVKRDIRLVAPLFQGIRMNMDDPLIHNSRWIWPQSWEAALAILQSPTGGFWIHARDTSYRYKALKTGTKNDPFSLGFDTEAYGPMDNNLAAGGLAWRINVFKGGWQVAADRYREWLWNAFDLKKEEEKRMPWIHDIRFAISWCPNDESILDALSSRIDPSKVLLHFPDWRTDIYDQNYPAYNASDKARSFIGKGKKMGFHVMPHFNSVDMDPSNPAYTWIRDFQYRSLETKQLMGWSWVDGKVLGVPESNQSRTENRNKNVMVKVHPGLSMWRSILGKSIQNASTDLGLDTVFIDVTLVSQNLHNCLVESTTSTEGMKKLISHIGSLNKGLVVGGEGLNEITMQGLSFAQAHLFKSWQTSIDGLERAGGCDLNNLIFGKLCRTIGYSGLNGKTKDDELRLKIHLEHGAIPTITIDSAEEIINPNAVIKKLLSIANS